MSAHMYGQRWADLWGTCWATISVYGFNRLGFYGFTGLRVYGFNKGLRVLRVYGFKDLRAPPHPHHVKSSRQPHRNAALLGRQILYMHELEGVH